MAVLVACLTLETASAHEFERLSNSTLGKIASKLKPGDFVEINTELPAGMASLSDLLRVPVDDGRRMLIDLWTDLAHWDPKRHRTFFIGIRKYKKFISYDAESNAWQVLGWEGEPPPQHVELGHTYGRTALDSTRGHYYWLSPGQILSRYWIDEERWEAVPGVKIGGYIPIEWHEKLDMLVAINRGGKMVAFSKGETKSIGASVVDGYHSVGSYNRTRGDMLFAGGNASRRKLELIEADGDVRRFRDAPINISVARTALSYDPKSGNYLFLQRQERQLHEFNPDLDEWRLIREWSESEWPFGKEGSSTPVVIDELGVIFWQSEMGIRVYRHRSAFDKPDRRQSLPN
ncbi:hypothetical protein [Aromatoleum aromaticum]|uniref:hypothetical protein n=1 Tax=Aromatoleum aromaticum TaxID=551760 RepID=UPI0006740DB6|nr:hypothetical protein [Aromatoleum aromaticum]